TGPIHGPIFNESAGSHIQIGTSNLTDLTPATPIAGRLYADPVWIQSGPTGNITQLTANIIATTGGNVRLGIYSDNGTPLVPGPGNLLYDSGSISVGAIGPLSTGAIAIAMPCTECYVWVVSVWKSTSTPSVTSLPVKANGLSGLYSATYADATIATDLPAS